MLRAGPGPRRARARAGLREPRGRARPRRGRARDPRDRPGSPPRTCRPPPRSRTARTPPSPGAQAGRGPEPIAHMCSGKHAAMLATCVDDGLGPGVLPRPGATRSRALVRATIAELTGDEPLPVVVDGCGAPAFSATVAGVARAYARIATAPRAPPSTASRRPCASTRGTSAAPARWSRSWAAPFPDCSPRTAPRAGFAAALPDGRALAVKVLDGSPRALPALVVALLRALGVDAPAPDPVLGGGAPVGEVRPTFVRSRRRTLPWQRFPRTDASAHCGVPLDVVAVHPGQRRVHAYFSARRKMIGSTASRTTRPTGPGRLGVARPRTRLHHPLHPFPTQPLERRERVVAPARRAGTGPAPPRPPAPSPRPAPRRARSRAPRPR